MQKLAQEILVDEQGHEDRLASKLGRIAEDESERGFLEKQFVQSWASQKTGVFLEAQELGVDVEQVLANFREAGSRSRP